MKQLFLLLTFSACFLSQKNSYSYSVFDMDSIEIKFRDHFKRNNEKISHEYLDQLINEFNEPRFLVDRAKLFFFNKDSSNAIKTLNEIDSSYQKIYSFEIGKIYMWLRIFNKANYWLTYAFKYESGNKEKIYEYLLFTHNQLKTLDTNFIYNAKKLFPKNPIINTFMNKLYIQNQKYHLIKKENSTTSTYFQSLLYSMKLNTAKDYKDDIQDPSLIHLYTRLNNRTFRSAIDFTTEYDQHSSFLRKDINAHINSYYYFDTKIDPYITISQLNHQNSEVIHYNYLGINSVKFYEGFWLYNNVLLNSDIFSFSTLIEKRYNQIQLKFGYSNNRIDYTVYTLKNKLKTKRISLDIKFITSTYNIYSTFINNSYSNLNRQFQSIQSIYFKSNFKPQVSYLFNHFYKLSENELSHIHFTPRFFNEFNVKFSIIEKKVQINPSLRFFSYVDHRWMSGYGIHITRRLSSRETDINIQLDIQRSPVWNSISLQLSSLLK